MNDMGNMGDRRLIDGVLQWGHGRGVRRGYRRGPNPREEGSDGLYIFHLIGKLRMLHNL
jgi:hypothetical protein